jgi:beta-lactamase class D
MVSLLISKTKMPDKRINPDTALYKSPVMRGVMHKHMIKYSIIIIAILLPVFSSAEDLVLSRLFAERGVDGTVVIYSLKNRQTFIHNNARANRRFSPASTFKIMNTLIAVEEKVIAGKDAVFKWDGHVYDLSSWNHDQTLASAFKVSCVWCYQELSRRIGAEKYRAYLKQSDYGELQSNFATTMFWLDGALQISALQQVSFLKKVVQQQLPFSKAAYETLQQIMLMDEAPAYSLWAKTGSARKDKSQVGWYVGYVETSKDIWIFALNMEIRNEKDLPLRQDLVRMALQAKGIIE